MGTRGNNRGSAVEVALASRDGGCHSLSWPPRLGAVPLTRGPGSGTMVVRALAATWTVRCALPMGIHNMMRKKE